MYPRIHNSYHYNYLLGINDKHYVAFPPLYSLPRRSKVSKSGTSKQEQSERKRYHFHALSNSRSHRSPPMHSPSPLISVKFDGLSDSRFVKKKQKKKKMEKSKELLGTVERDQHYRISAIGVRSEFRDGCADPMCLH